MPTKQDYLNCVDFYFRSLEKIERAKKKGTPYGTYDTDMRNASIAAKNIDAQLERFTSVVNLELNSPRTISDEEIELNALRCAVTEGKTIVLELMNLIAHDDVSIRSNSLNILKKANAFIL